MSNTAKWIVGIIVVAAVVVGVVAAGDDSQDGSSDEEIRIGAVLSLTGAAAQDGESIQNGIELAKKDLAEAGTDVEVVYQDDGTESAQTVSAINALATQDVQAIIGPTWSFLADAGIPVLERQGLVTVMPAGSSEYVNAESPNAFFASTRIDQSVPILENWLSENQKTRIAIIKGQGAWYETVSAAVEEAADAVGAEIVFTEEIPFSADPEAVRAAVTKMRASNPDLIIGEIEIEQQIVTLFNTLEEQGVTADVLSVATSVERVMNNQGAATESENNVYALAPQSSDEFTEKYRDEYGTDVPPYADRAYDSLMILVDALQNKGEDTSLSTYLQEETDYEGVLGTYNFDENGDIVGGEWVVKQIR